MCNNTMNKILERTAALWTFKHTLWSECRYILQWCGAGCFRCECMCVANQQIYIFINICRTLLLSVSKFSVFSSIYSRSSRENRNIAYFLHFWIFIYCNKVFFSRLSKLFSFSHLLQNRDNNWKKNKIKEKPTGKQAIFLLYMQYISPNPFTIKE